MSSMLILLLFTTVPDILWTAFTETGVSAVESISDINGNGSTDIVVALPHPATPGLYCLDGLAGIEIWSSDSVPGTKTHEALCIMSDINDDGINDIALSTDYGNGPFDCSTIAVSGADGSIIWSTALDSKGTHYGYDTEFTDAVSDSCRMVHTSYDDYGYDRWVHFKNYNAETGEEFWSYSVSTIIPDIIPMADFSGNDCDELALAVSRGTVYWGWFAIRDGLTGESLYYLDSWFPESFTASHPSEYPLLCVNQNTSPPKIRVFYFPGANEILTIDWIPYNSEFFVTNINGEYYPLPELALANSNEICFMSPDNGETLAIYQLGSPVNCIDTFEYNNVFNFPMGTDAGLALALYDSSDSEVEWSLPLPQAVHDISLITSSNFPTPLIAAAMLGENGGVVAVTTSSQTGIAEHVPFIGQPSWRPVSNPSSGGVFLVSESKIRLTLRFYDISGRLWGRYMLEPGEILFINPPLGVYLIYTEEYPEILSQKIIVLE